MYFFIIVKVAFRNLWANKMRTSLTMLGVIIGVSAVITMTAVGEGTKVQITEQIKSFGTNLLSLRAGLGGHRGVRSENVKNLTLEDAEAIKKYVYGIEAAAPIIMINKQVKYRNKNTRTTVIGTTSEYFGVRNFYIENGRPFSNTELRKREKVCVLGAKVADDLFEEKEPIGSYIKIGGISFLVIGYTRAKGDMGWFNPDDQIFIPISTAMKRLAGVNYLRSIDIQVVSMSEIKNTKRILSQFMRKRHNIRAQMPDDFYIRDQAEYLESMQKVSKTFTHLLGSVASISLLVGGIGIMNIMLVTVTERTKEIGIRKAIGAKKMDILKQFLIESIILSLFGGVLGIMMGIGLARTISSWISMQTFITPWSMIVSFLFSVGIGVFFGFYPAAKAAGMNPIDALRYE